MTIPHIINRDPDETDVWDAVPLRKAFPPVGIISFILSLLMRSLVYYFTKSGLAGAEVLSYSFLLLVWCGRTISVT